MGQHTVAGNCRDQIVFRRCPDALLLAVPIAICIWPLATSGRHNLQRTTMALRKPKARLRTVCTEKTRESAIKDETGSRLRALAAGLAWFRPKYAGLLPLA